MNMPERHLPEKPGKFTKSQKEQEFARQYILDFNAGKAYGRCPWAPENRSGWSTSGTKLLALESVQGYIRDLIEERKRRMVVSIDSVIMEQARIGFSDIRNYFTWDADGNIQLRESSILDEDYSRAIESLEIVDSQYGRKIKLKLHSKAVALESLAKHLGMYTERHSIDVNYGTIELPAIVQASDWAKVVKQETGDGSGNGT